MQVAGAWPHLRKYSAPSVQWEDTVCNGIIIMSCFCCVSSCTVTNSLVVLLSLPNSVQDFAEDFKIRSFVSMVRACESLCVPVISDNELFSAMSIESWPLIQAFGLEDYGGGGFLTLRYTVSSIWEQLAPVLARVDGYGLQYVAENVIPRLQRHCEEICLMISAATPTARGKLTEVCKCFHPRC